MSIWCCDATCSVFNPCGVQRLFSCNPLKIVNFSLSDRIFQLIEHTLTVLLKWNCKLWFVQIYPQTLWQLEAFLNRFLVDVLPVVFCKQSACQCLWLSQKAGIHEFLDVRLWHFNLDRWLLRSCWIPIEGQWVVWGWLYLSSFDLTPLLRQICWSCTVDAKPVLSLNFMQYCREVGTGFTTPV